MAGTMRLDNPTVTSSRVSILHSPVSNLRKKIFDLEERFDSKMEQEFLSPDLNPIPEDAPPQIPRIEFESTHGHSNLSITPVRTDLKTKFDKEYHNEVEKCLNYIKKKSEAISEVADVIEPDLSFFAISVTVRWPQKQISNEEVINLLGDNLTSERIKKMDLKNFQLNYSLEDSGIFKLIQISNYRTFSSSSPINTPYPRIEELEEKGHGFEKEIEINDRPKYNRGEESKGITQVSDFLEMAKSEIDSPIPS